MEIIDKIKKKLTKLDFDVDKNFLNMIHPFVRTFIYVRQYDEGTMFEDKDFQIILTNLNIKMGFIEGLLEGLEIFYVEAHKKIIESNNKNRAFSIIKDGVKTALIMRACRLDFGEDQYLKRRKEVFVSHGIQIDNRKDYPLCAYFEEDLAMPLPTEDQVKKYRILCRWDAAF